MKRNVLVFIFLVLAVLIAIPAKNIITTPKDHEINWQEKSFLYNMDFASRWTAMVLYPLGISTDPKQVIIGKNGWLFLGDMYNKTLSTDRRLATDTDHLTAKNIEIATAAWSAYLSGHGIKLFRVMVGPNKGTIYPEKIPKWARPVSPNPTDALFAADAGRYYVDLRPALTSGKSERDEDIYFKTDTHWNTIGAGIAFKEFARQIAMAAPDIKWPAESLYELVKVNPRREGDLAKFLRLSSSLGDLAPELKVTDFPLIITQIDFTTGKILSTGSNVAIKSSNKPLLVKSSGALNNKKVLWLRDSFGTSLSPLMAATFSDVIQLHWSEALKSGGPFTRLVDDWQPDYVFVTVVEREARAEVFTLLPPPSFVRKDDRFKVTATSSPVKVNSLLRGKVDHQYEISGNDAFVDFSLSAPINSNQNSYLNLDFSCFDDSPSVPIQLFWMGDGAISYSEKHSARILLRTGKYLLDLRTVPNWPIGSSVSRVRIDVDPGKSCHRFEMNNPAIGTKSD